MNNMTFYLIIGACLIILLAGIMFLAFRSETKSSGLWGEKNSSPVGGDGWSAEMGWRYVSYIEENTAIALQIEPMARGEDIVYVPDEANWLKSAPDWARQRREEILARLKSVMWNRRLVWQQGKGSFGASRFVPGSLESTWGGQRLEKRRMFHPGSKITHEEAHELWHDAARLFAGQARGEVTIFKGAQGMPGTVFQEVELPALEINPNVTLVFKTPD
ncbi:MAG TPA: hypothetical protein VGB68_08870 [Pyrinomonadaceae bacterium]